MDGRWTTSRWLPTELKVGRLRNVVFVLMEAWNR
jgi:hypothetical protein